MKQSRRNFLNKSGKAVIAASVASAFTWDALAETKSLISANDKINVGVIGVNGMGWSDLTSFMKIPEVNVAALCDVDDNVLNYRKYELAKNGMQTKTYGDYRKMLENKDLDVIIIGTPDHWHCLQMVEACEAG
jgi:predicted dehydrogenase